MEIPIAPRDLLMTLLCSAFLVAMSFASTLDQARDFLLLPPDLPAADALQAARDREAEWRAKSSDARAPALARASASRKLRQLEPLLPLLELEAELAALEQVAAVPGPAIHKLRLDRNRLADRVSGLPENDERLILLARLKAVEVLLNPAAPTPPPPTVLPPLPLPPDPATAALAAKFDELRAALGRNEVSKSRLTGLLDAARALSSVLRDEAAREEAALTLRDFEARLRDIITSRTRSPFADPTARILAARIAALHTAVDQKKISRAPFLLEAAREIAADLEDPTAREEAEAELRVIGQRLEALLTPAAAPPAPLPPDPAVAVLAGQIATIDSALAAGELAAAVQHLAAATGTSLLLRDPAGREAASVTLAQLGERVRSLEAERDAEHARQAAVRERVIALREILEGGDPTPAAEVLSEIRTQLDELHDRVAQQQIGAELVGLAARLVQLEDTARAAAALKAAVAEKLAAARTAAERGDDATGARLLEEVLPMIARVADPALREATARTADELATRLKPPVTTPVRRPQPGLVLRLIPSPDSFVTGIAPPALHFVARPRFVLGRFASEGSSLADFSCPSGEKRVSRVHVTLSLRGEDVLISDGDGVKPSVNGSKLDDETLAVTPVPASFAGERTIALGPVFAVAAQHLPSSAPGGPPQAEAGSFATTGRTMVVSLVTGCLRFLPRGDATVPALGVWLFTDATIGAAPGNAVVLPNLGLAEVQCRVHFWQQAFWIENLRSGAVLRLGDRALAKGEVMALNSGDRLHLAQAAYTVAIDS